MLQMHKNVSQEEEELLIIHCQQHINIIHARAVLDEMDLILVAAWL